MHPGEDKEVLHEARDGTCVWDDNVCVDAPVETDATEDIDDICVDAPTEREATLNQHLEWKECVLPL